MTLENEMDGTIRLVLDQTAQIVADRLFENEGPESNFLDIAGNPSFCGGKFLRFCLSRYRSRHQKKCANKKEEFYPGKDHGHTPFLRLNLFWGDQVVSK